jgi:site-specific recombinase XerD
MINKFLDYISVEKRYSQNTLVSYKKDLEDLLTVHFGNRRNGRFKKGR